MSRMLLPMCGGLAINKNIVEQKLREKFDVPLTTMEGRSDLVRFQYRDRIPLLPALYHGELDVYFWGNRDDKMSILPRTGWCKVESLHAGRWKRFHPEDVEIPASMGLERGVWFPIEKGMRGILVQDEQKMGHVFMLTQPASMDYLALTKHERMPVFL